jgi:hypothetical protein
MEPAAPFYQSPQWGNQRQTFHALHFELSRPADEK